MFDALRIKPEKIQSLEDLRLLPFSNKKTLLERPVQDRLGLPETSCVRMSTSGTTGGPMPVFYSKDFYSYIAALYNFRVRRTQGAPYFGSSVMINYDARANDRQYMSGKPPSKRRGRGLGILATLFGPVHDRMTKRLYIGSGAEDIMDDLSRLNPRRVLGSPAYFRLVADAVNSGKCRGIRPRTILCFGEPFDEPTRDYLAGTFGCDVYDGYGTNETGPVAIECRYKSGLHIIQDSLVVEVLNDGKPARPGEEGDVYVTSLKNRGMPLFRYDVGDRAVMGDSACRCGRRTQKLESVEGRSTDFVTSSDGHRVSPRKIGTIMHSVQGLPRCQLVELREFEYRLRVFGQSSDPVDELVLALRKELGDVDMEVSLENPEALRAKFRLVVSMRSPSLDNGRTQPFLDKVVAS